MVTGWTFSRASWFGPLSLIKDGRCFLLEPPNTPTAGFPALQRVKCERTGGFRPCRGKTSSTRSEPCVDATGKALHFLQRGDGARWLLTFSERRFKVDAPGEDLQRLPGTAGAAAPPSVSVWGIYISVHSEKRRHRGEKTGKPGKATSSLLPLQAGRDG